MSAALVGRFFTTEPPGKPLAVYFLNKLTHQIDYVAK